jgi:hypothetical protein
MPQPGIEVRQRLIEQQTCRPHRHRPRQGNALLLAARELIGFPLAILLHLHQRQRLIDALILLGRTESPHLQAKANVLPHAHVRPQCITLKTHHCIARLRGQRRDIVIVKENPPAGGLHQPRDQPQQRAFPAAAGPQQKEKFAGIDLQVNIIHGHRCAEMFGDFFQPHRRHIFDSNAEDCI